MLLGIDIGTTHTKVGCYSRRGELLAHQQEKTPLLTGDNGLRYFALEGIWQVVSELLRRTLATQAEPLEGLAIASMGEAGVTIAATGEPTYPVIPWYDARATPQMAALSRELSAERFYAITGLYPNAIHTVAKWCWLQEHAPEAWAKTRLWLGLSDYFGFRLTGQAVMEASQAARTMAFDVTQRAWSDAILALAHVPHSLLPPVVPAASLVGTVHAAAAAATGLPVGTPVFAGGHDHICAAFACGALTPEVALDSLGTAEGLTLGLPGGINPMQAAGLGVGPHVAPGHSYLLGGVYSSGGALEWVKGLLGLEGFAALSALAALAPTGESPLFIAQFRGAAPPINDPQATGAFLDVTPEHRPEHIARAVYEGIAFEVRAGLEVFEQVAATPISIVRMVGGGVSDPLWPRIRAAVLQRPLEIARYPDMVTLGAALLAGLGAGVYDSPLQAVAATYQPRQHFYPDPDWLERYTPLYPRYLTAARALRRWRQELPQPSSKE